MQGSKERLFPPPGIVPGEERRRSNGGVTRIPAIFLRSRSYYDGDWSLFSYILWPDGMSKGIPDDVAATDRKRRSVPAGHAMMESCTIPVPEAVIFDFDGVIVDTEPLHFKALRRVLEPFGIRFEWEEYVRTYMGFDDRDAFREAFRSRGIDLDDRRMSDLLSSKSEIFQGVIRGGVRDYPGAVAVISSLHAAGLPLAISSGALRSDILPVLRQLRIDHCFRHIVAADDVRKSKPDPESYTLAFLRLKGSHPGLLTTPHRSLAVEDTPAGIRSAKRAGLRVLAVTNSCAEEELAEADYLTGSLSNVTLPGRG